MGFRDRIPVIDKQMVVFTMICIAVAICFYALFQIPFVVPAYMVFDSGIVLVLIAGLGWYLFYRIRKNVQMANVIEKCILNNLNAIEVYEVGSGNAELVPGEKKNPDDVIYETDLSGVQIDPSLTTQSAEPTRYPGGLDVFHYSYFNWVPLTKRNHLAYSAIIRWWKQKCPELHFLSEIEFIALISTPIHHLQHDLENYLAKYFHIAEVEVLEPLRDKDGNIRKDEEGNELVSPKIDEKGNKIFRMAYYRDTYDSEGKTVRQEVTTGELILVVENAKTIIWNDLAPSIGYTAGNEAFRYNAMAHMAQDFFEAMKLVETMAMEEAKKLYDWMTIGMIIIGIIVAGGVAVYVASMAFGK